MRQRGGGKGFRLLVALLFAAVASRRWLPPPAGTCVSTLPRGRFCLAQPVTSPHRPSLVSALDPPLRFLIRRKTMGHHPSALPSSPSNWSKAYGGDAHDGDAAPEDPPTLGRLSSGGSRGSGSRSSGTRSIGSRGSSLYLSCLSAGGGDKVQPAPVYSSSRSVSSSVLSVGLRVLVGRQLRKRTPTRNPCLACTSRPHRSPQFFFCQEHFLLRRTVAPRRARTGW